MRYTSKTLSLLALLVCLMFATEARADTFFITGGSATSGNILGGTFTLTGSNFELHGGFYQGPNSCSPCKAGQTISVGSFNLGLDIVSQPIPSTFGGTTYNTLYYSLGSMRFSSGIIVPNTSDALFTVTTPFSFTATLQGCTDPQGPINFCHAGDIVFDNATFIGQGTATVQMSSVSDGADGHLYSIRSIRYDFAAPTPEPATIVLLSTGLAGAGAIARRRRGRRAASKKIA